MCVQMHFAGVCFSCMCRRFSAQLCVGSCVPPLSFRRILFAVLAQSYLSSDVSISVYWGTENRPVSTVDNVPFTKCLTKILIKINYQKTYFLHRLVPFKLLITNMMELFS